jgi:hypothetical protein
MVLHGMHAVMCAPYAGHRLPFLSVQTARRAAGVCALGPPGRYVVGVSTVCEFFGASCIMLVVLWKEVETLLGGSGGALLCSSVDRAVVSVLVDGRTWTLLGVSPARMHLCR